VIAGRDCTEELRTGLGTFTGVTFVVLGRITLVILKSISSETF